MGIDLPDKNAFDDCQARVAGVRGNTGVRDHYYQRLRDPDRPFSSVPKNLATSTSASSIRVKSCFDTALTLPVATMLTLCAAQRPFVEGLPPFGIAH
jgi:hypothetical protein